MRLDEFLLTEKISKKEMDIALKNKNIRIGAEFEFIVNIDSVKDDWTTAWFYYHKQENEYNRYEHQLDNFMNDFDDWKRDLNNADDEDKDNIEKLEPEPPELPDYIKYGDSDYRPGEEIPPPIEPDVPELDHSDDEQIFKSIIDLIPLKELPFKVDISYTHQGMERLNNWIIEPDSSLTDGGVELISPILTMDEFLKVTPEIFNFIDRHGYTDHTCGLHTHMSIKGVHYLHDVLDPVKLVLFTDEGLIYKFFNERAKAEYAASMLKDLRKNKINRDTLKELINMKKLDDKAVSISHYMGINMEHLKQFYGEEAGSSRVEFRYLGGTDYQKKWSKIRQIVGNYAHVLSISMDPEYKKKEYIHKLTRIMNKVDLVRKKIELDHLDVDNKADNEMSIKIRRLNKEIGMLQKLYRLSDKEESDIRNWIRWE